MVQILVVPTTCVIHTTQPPLAGHHLSPFFGFSTGGLRHLTPSATCPSDQIQWSNLVEYSLCCAVLALSVTRRPWAFDLPAEDSTSPVVKTAAGPVLYVHFHPYTKPSSPKPLAGPMSNPHSGRHHAAHPHGHDRFRLLAVDNNFNLTAAAAAAATAPRPRNSRLVLRLGVTAASAVSGFPPDHVLPRFGESLPGWLPHDGEVCHTRSAKSLCRVSFGGKRKRKRE